jgi:hypothetical protein
MIAVQKLFNDGKNILSLYSYTSFLHVWDFLKLFSKKMPQ